MSVFRLTVLLILLVPLMIIVSITAPTSASPMNDGLSSDLEDIVVGLPLLTFSSGALAAVIRQRFKIQIALNRQILLDFFLYGWRNTLYRRWSAQYEFIIKPDTFRCFRLFYWSPEPCGSGKEVNAPLWI